MDAQALQKLLTHLISQGPLSEMLKGVVSVEDGQIKVVFSGGVDDVNLEQIKELLDTITKNIVLSGQTDAVMDVASIGPGVLTVVVKSGDDDPPEGSSKSTTPTLRDSIDQEWPW
jgi:hypothetical protein